ncbi:MAG TPA: ATPase domain-containing protein, partial [Gammaproteobacteria bacterium]|nr:ATPase domain-containing protein [Gammaproteobacteria bacterium]
MSEQRAAHVAATGEGVAAVPLEATGVPHLDDVLGGGLPRGALVIVAGPPGSGKTTLANQMAFAAAERGRRVLVLSALSEPTSKLLDHLRGFRFFNQELIGDSLQFISLEYFLSQGLEATSDGLLASAKAARADYVVLDGFRGVRGVDPDPQRARQFLYDVGTTLSLQGATTVITSEADARDPAFYPELTTADVIIGLHFTLEDVRHERGLEAVKIRGGAPLPGLHSLVLDAAGMTIYPRLEVRVHSGVSEPAAAEERPEQFAGQARAGFDLPELDALLMGGLTRHTSTLLAGSLGAGKTHLAVHFALAGVRAGEPVVFLGFRETAAQLTYRAELIGLGDLWRTALARGGGLTLLRFDPLELDPDQIADRLLRVLDQTGAKRLVLDSVAELEAAVLERSTGKRLRNYLVALLVALRSRGVTLVAVTETHAAIATDLGFAAEPMAVLAENVLLLQQVAEEGRLRRMLAVVKTRFSAHTAGLREFVITGDQGVRVLPASEDYTHRDCGSSSNA